MAHKIFSNKKTTQLQVQYPNAIFFAHPQCKPHILEKADDINSTSGLLKYTKKNEADTFIVTTEAGILHQMEIHSTHKTSITAPPNIPCACNRISSYEKKYNGEALSLYGLLLELEWPQQVIKKGRNCIDKMLDISQKAGL